MTPGICRNKGALDSLNTIVVGGVAVTGVNGSSNGIGHDRSSDTASSGIVEVAAAAQQQLCIWVLSS